MGSPVELRDEIHVEYMYGLLGYDTWILCDGPVHIGVVTLNGPDNSVELTFHRNFEPWMAFFADRSFRWWMQFVRTHAVPRL